MNFRETRKLWLDQHKTPCHFCGEREPCCLQFHHLHPPMKLFNISDGYAKYPLREVELEMAKCIVICANCHAKVHAGLIEMPMLYGVMA